MYCTRCGVELRDSDYYCFQCGTATGNAPAPPPPRPLLRSATDKRIAGVCGGFARYMEMDPTLVRVLWLLLTFGLPPAGVIGYIAAWIIVPQEPEPYVAYTAPAAPPASAT